MIEEINEIHNRLAETTTDLEMLDQFIPKSDRDNEELMREIFTVRATRKLDTYLQYVAIGEYFRPKKIAAIGVRYAYDAISIMLGAMNSGIQSNQFKYWGFDDESYATNSNAIAKANFTKLGVADITLSKINTVGVEKLPGIMPKVNLFIVDGVHSPAENVLHDLELAWSCLRKHSDELGCGVLVIDDIDFIPHVKEAAHTFCEKMGVEYHYIQSLRGIYVILKTY